MVLDHTGPSVARDFLFALAVLLVDRPLLIGRADRQGEWGVAKLFRPVLLVHFHVGEMELRLVAESVFSEILQAAGGVEPQTHVFEVRYNLTFAVANVINMPTRSIFVSRLRKVDAVKLDSLFQFLSQRIGQGGWHPPNANVVT